MFANLLLAALAAVTWANELYDDPQTLPNRQTMVHLFEWKWKDIAKECEDFLQHYGYGAVQISPPMEHIWLKKNNDVPWWIRYQPVSYKLQSRSGTEKEFDDMVNRCNKVGVRIIVDGVINHMVGVGQKKGVNGISSSGDSDFDGTDGVESFPGVPYTKDHFDDWRCHGDINGGDYNGNAERVRNCRLTGLLDLNQGHDYVREKVIAYMNMLIAKGVAGFRLDASKHMWPGDLDIILKGMDNLRSDIFGANKRPFVVHEVIDQGNEAVKCAEYVDIGRYTDFNYGTAVVQAVRKERDLNQLLNLKEGYNGYGNLASHDVLAFIDNHDNQRSNSWILTYKNGDQYALSVGFMLGWDYGYPRVMSSYYFTYSDQGPPSLGAAGNFATRSPVINSQYKTCEESSGFVCEHRWFAVRGMARFRQEVIGTGIDNKKSESNRLAFGRGGKGYFAANNGNGVWRFSAQTGMKAGAYCDVWTGELQNGACTGVTINVKGDGTASFTVPAGQFVAIHNGWKI